MESTPVSPGVPAANRLAGELRAVFGDRLRSLVIYGQHARHIAASDSAANPPRDPIHTLALVDTIEPDDLMRCASLSAGWAHRGLATPLILRVDEFSGSLDAFPLEYGEIIRAHVLVIGTNPFQGVSVQPADLRRACEVQTKSHLLHLREGYIEGGGTPGAVARLITASVPAFRTLLSNVMRLSGLDADDIHAYSRHAGALGLPPDVVAEVSALREPRDLAGTDTRRLFAAYLGAADALARYVDRWTA